jgi:hypothetical protein
MKGREKRTSGFTLSTPNESSDMIGKMTLEGHSKKKGTIGRITLESFSIFFVILGDNKK